MGTSVRIFFVEGTLLLWLSSSSSLSDFSGDDTIGGELDSSRRLASARGVIDSNLFVWLVDSAVAAAIIPPSLGWSGACTVVEAPSEDLSLLLPWSIDTRRVDGSAAFPNNSVMATAAIMAMRSCELSSDGTCLDDSTLAADKGGASEGWAVGVATLVIVDGSLMGVAAASTSAETHLGCGRCGSTETIPSAVEGGGPGWSVSGAKFLQLVQRQFKPQYTEFWKHSQYY